MKSLNALAAIMAMSMVGIRDYSNRINTDNISPELPEKPMPSNFKRWVIDGKEVWASTKKAAIKKSKK